MPCTRARSSHTRQRTSSYDEPSAARRPRRGRAHSSAPRGRRAPSLQSTLFIAAPQGHSGRNHSVWGTRAATRHRKRHPPSCVVDPPRASFRPAPLPTDLRPRILYRPPPRAGSYNLRSGSCTYLTPHAQAAGESGLTVLQARADSQSKATLYHTQSGNACVDIHHDSQRQACCGGHDQGRCSMCGARQSSERRIPTRASCQGDARRHRTSRSHAGRGGGRPGGWAPSCRAPGRRRL
jgi:hypothetical protein